MSETREIRTDYLARVEGEGAMLVRVRDGALEEVQFKIFEPPRFFEALLRGRKFTEAPDITARICGICPIAYMASSAARDGAGVRRRAARPGAALRRLIYCGEWIESHVLHMAMLHAPDFLGYDGAIELARDRRDLVEIALRLKKLGNEVMRVVGGREVHPVNLRVGGFYRAPTAAELRALVPELEWARDAARRADPLDGRVRLPRLRARLRVRVAAAARRVPDRARPHRLQHRARHLRRRVRGALHRDPRRALERAALDARGRRHLPRRPAGALRAQLRGALRRGQGGRRGGRARPRVPQPVPLHRRARGRDRVRGRRGPADHRRLRAAGGARGRVRPARGVGARLHRGAARHLLAPLPDRRRGDDPRREDRAADLPEPEDDRGGPDRRRQRLARTCPTTSWPTAASRRSATTTRASRARRTSSASRWSVSEGRGGLPGEPVPRRRRRRPARGGTAARRGRSGARLRDEPTRLLDLWDGLDTVVVVDALRSDARARDAPSHRGRGRPAAARPAPRVDARDGDRRRARARPRARAGAAPRRRARHRGRRRSGWARR